MRRLALICLLASAACGGSLVRSDDSWRQRFPASRYLAAEGENPTSRDAAIADARARVSDQVGVSIRVVLEDRLGKVGAQEMQDILRKVIQTSSFRHAGLARPVEDLTRCDRGGCRAVVVMSLQEATAVLLEDYRTLAAGFRSAARRGIAPDMDVQSFTTAFREAAAAWPRLEELGAQIQVLARSAVPDFQSDAEAFRELLTKRGDWLGRLHVRILPPAEGALGNAVGSVLVAAFGKLGLTAGVGLDCQGDALAFGASASQDCTSGHFGPVCIIRLSGFLRECQTRSPLAPVELPEIGRGAHPRSLDSAAAASLKALDPAKVAEALRRQLEAVLPVS